MLTLIIPDGGYFSESTGVLYLFGNWTVGESLQWEKTWQVHAGEDGGSNCIDRKYIFQ